MRGQEECRVASLFRADGVVDPEKNSREKHFRLILNHHPVRSNKGSFAIFLWMSRPPLLAERGDAASDFKRPHYQKRERELY
jgi:hypothetical protein